MKTVTAKQEHFVSTRNACKLCSPLGACFAMRGIEGCIPLIHGSQGCSTYIRRYGISHFREPIDIASSNFVEATAIFGGRDNLFRAIDNVTRQYRPSAIGITSTCLSETIGENVSMYLREYLNKRELGEAGFPDCQPVLFYCSTPSYRGTHIEGFHETIHSVIQTMTENKPQDSPEKRERVNLISGFVSAEDLRELHAILRSFEVPYTLLPDYSESLDGGAWEEYQKLPKGGVLLNQITAMTDALGTVYLGKAVAAEQNGALYLWENFHVPAKNIELPIGVENTDVFFASLEQMIGKPTPDEWKKHRNRLIDAYFDGHKYCEGKRAILYGEEDFVAAMAAFLDEIGVVPVIAATGAAGMNFEERLASLLHNTEIIETPKNLVGTLRTTSRRKIRKETKVMAEADFAEILEASADLKPDFVIGNSKGYYLARQLEIPLVRCGFPIHDRIGGHRILHLGYRGTLNLFERICNALMEAKQNQAKSGWTYI